MVHHALLIEVDYMTGERPNGIDPHDEALQCYSWQSTPTQGGADIEIRLIEDDRDPEQYVSDCRLRLEDGTVIEDPAVEDLERGVIEDFEGVMLLEGEEEINRGIEATIPTRKLVNNREDLWEMVQRNEDLDANEAPIKKPELVAWLENHGVEPYIENPPPLLDAERGRVIERKYFEPYEVAPGAVDPETGS